MRTKKELIDALAERTQQPKKVAEAFVDALGGAVHESLAKGEEVILPGLGKFSVKDKPARTGRNPATGETIQIPAKTVVKFRVAKAAKEAVL